MITIIKESYKNSKINKKYKKEGTSNFYYKNRCVVVTDEDYENDNVPPLSDRPIDNNRSYPAYEVDIWKLYKDDYEEEYFKIAKDQAIKLYDSEIDKANRIIDKIKEDFGYDEYKVSARFSNGETWYSKIK